MSMVFHELAGILLVWRDYTINLLVPYANNGDGGCREKLHFSTC